MPGTLNMVMFSNFEGFVFEPAPVLAWFEALSAAHPGVRWTHLYNPRYMLVGAKFAAIGGQVTPYLLEKQARGLAEVGVHMHMYYDMVQAMGVSPRAWPFFNDTAPTCDTQRDLKPGGGYDVPITAYAQSQRETMIDACLAAFAGKGFTPPRSFCAGYSATDPALQALLASRGFRASLAAQTVGPDVYPKCWFTLLNWHRQVSPLSQPYRVPADSISPSENAGEYLNLTEIPLNMGVDKNTLFCGDKVESREEMLNLHCRKARETGESTVVFGVHAEVIAKEQWGNGEVSHVMDRYLTHATQEAHGQGLQIKYLTGSDVAAQHFQHK